MQYNYINSIIKIIFANIYIFINVLNIFFRMFYMKEFAMGKLLKIMCTLLKIIYILINNSNLT